MSVVIKSDNAANNHFGQLAMLGTTAIAEYEKYKARVLSDGGEIRDEAYTKALFDKFFNNNIYGNIATYVSGKTGVKLNSEGGITKLYSLQGEDLVAKKFGTAPLPTLTTDNAIDFSNNQVQIYGKAKNGTLFTTERQVRLSKIGNFGLGLKSNVATKPQSGSNIAGLTKHNDEQMKPFGTNHALAMVINSSLYYLRASRDPLVFKDLTNASNSFYVSGDPVDGGSITSGGFVSRPKDMLKQAFQNGQKTWEMTEQNAQTFSNLDDLDFYLDFGGLYYSDYLEFYNGKAYDFWFLKEADEQSVKSLTSF